VTDEQTDAEPEVVDRLADLGRPLVDLPVDEPMALKSEDDAGEIYHSDTHWVISIPDLMALLTPVAIYSKAFLETLAKHHADAVADLLSRSWRKSGPTAEAEIGLDGDAAAKILVTADIPDEARLALLDLDVTAEELRGKVLRWDAAASAWRPADDR